MVHYLDVENNQTSFGWEHPENITLVANTPTATTITGFSGLTVNEYAGQCLRVLDGNQKGNTYWVIENTATAMTVQGSTTPNEGGNAIEAGARVAVSTNGIIPSTYDQWFGIVKGGTPPEAEVDIAEHRGHGYKNRLASSINKIDYKGGKLPIQLQVPRILMAMGDKVTSQGTTDATLVTAINNATHIMPWENVVTLDSVVGLVAGTSYLQFEGAQGYEVRKVTAINSNDVTLDVPLYLKHLDNEVVQTVVAPLTITVYSGAKLAMRSFTIVDVTSDPYGVESDLIRTWSGCYLGQADFRGAIDKELLLDVQIWAMTDAIDPAGVTKPSVTPDTDEFYYWDDMTIEVNSVPVALGQKCDVSWNNNLEYKRALRGHKAKKPYRIESAIWSGKTAISFNPVNKVILSDLRDPSELDATVGWERGTNDTLSFDLQDGRAGGGKTPWPDQGKFETSFERMEESATLTIVTEEYIY